MARHHSTGRPPTGSSCLPTARVIRCSVDDGTLTRTMKPRRDAIFKKCAACCAAATMHCGPNCMQGRLERLHLLALAGRLHADNVALMLLQPPPYACDLQVCN